MRIVIIGAGGQLGSDLVRALKGSDIIPLTHRDIDINAHEAASDILSSARPDIIINSAAYNLVDESEDNPEQPFATNAFAVRNLAKVCERIRSVLVHISTDFVFDGGKGYPYKETDPPNPVNLYGVSKLAGEYFTRNISTRYYIFRVASLFGVTGSRGKGGNFVETMIKKAEKGEQITVVSDLVMSPTYTWDAAVKINEVIMGRATFGIYHLANSGYCSWYEFAKAIFDMSGTSHEIEPKAVSEMGLRAKRPRFSALDNERLRSAGFVDMRGWRDALKEYLSAKGYIRG